MTAQIGADPEFFLKTKAGVITPSCNLIGGTKGKGISITGAQPDILWLEDNAAVELNWPSTKSPNTFAEYAHLGRRLAEESLAKKGLLPLYQATVDFGKDIWGVEKAQVIGCDPDLCAYEMHGQRRVIGIAELGTHRHAAGHIHLSWTNKENIPAYAVAMLLDCFITLPTLALDPQGDRRKLYGKAGIYREKSYGIEYRTMSNWWLRRHVDSFLPTFADVILNVGNNLEQKPLEISKLFAEIPFVDVREAIDNEQTKDARMLYESILRMPAIRACNLNYPIDVSPYIPKTK